MPRIPACLWWLLSVLWIVVAEAQEASPRYWSDAWRGWHFYEEPEPRPKGQRDARPSPPRRPAPAPARPAEIVEFERLQKAVEQTRHIAIMRPTEANVRRYMELEAQVVARASTFADMAQRIAWATPELDPTLQGRPVNAKALEVFEQTELADRSRSIAELGRDHVLFFFYRSDCPYCHAFSPTLEAFSARFGIQIVPISVDGKGLPSFPTFRRDNGIARTLQVTQVPAIYLAEPYTGKIVPIGFGVLSESQLIERITTVTAPGADAYAPSITRRVNLQ